MRKVIAIYARQSRDENDKNIDTIETQVNLLIDYANSNFPNKYKIYVDDNVSGVDFKRKGLEQLKKDIEEKIVKILLIKDLSRLGRNNVKTLMFLDYLEEKDVRVITFDGRYDSLKDNDTVGLDTWYNERYAKDISKKIRANLRYKIKNGEYIGTAPFGYKKSKILKNRLEINKDESEIVKEIFELYKSEYGYKSIAKFLNDKYGSYKGYKWNSLKIKRILENSVYIGDTVQGISEKVSYKSKKIRKLPREKWIITKNTHPAIINAKDFKTVQEIREKKGKKFGGNKGEIALLRGIIFCGDCGSSMIVRRNKKNEVTYICSNYAQNGKNACMRHSIDEREIKEEIKREIKNLLENKNEVLYAINIYQKKINEKKEKNIDIEEINKYIKTLQRKQEVLYMDKLDMNISTEFFNKINKDLENKIKISKQKLKEIKKMGLMVKREGKYILDGIDNIREINITRGLVKSMVDKIFIFEDYEKNKKVLMQYMHKSE